MAVIAVLVFASALAVSLAVIWLTLLPALPRISALLRTGADRIATPPGATLLKDFRPRPCAREMAVPEAIQPPPWRAAA